MFEKNFASLVDNGRAIVSLFRIFGDKYVLKLPSIIEYFLSFNMTSQLFLSEVSCNWLRLNIIVSIRAERASSKYATTRESNWEVPWLEHPGWSGNTKWPSRPSTVPFNLSQEYLRIGDSLSFPEHHRLSPLSLFDCCETILCHAKARTSFRLFWPPFSYKW